MSNIAVREFELLNYAFYGGARVPEPYRRIENMFSMQYIGSADGPAPPLQGSNLRDPENFLRLTLEGIDKLATSGIIHTDMSPFNLLVFNNEPWFIDLADAIRADRLGIPPWLKVEEARKALIKGLSSLQKYFDKYGLSIDSRSIQNLIISKIDKFSNY
jgi:serine/threonine-protein kinase RIO1